MKLRVVTDQPWDVPADVLVIPVAAEPAFEAPSPSSTGAPAASWPRSPPSAS